MKQIHLLFLTLLVRGQLGRLQNGDHMTLRCLICCKYMLVDKLLDFDHVTMWMLYHFFSSDVTSNGCETRVC